ncbi:TonB-dependent receptor [Sphingomonas sp. RHCKR7]|uniref:TonB-dependent receptor domain-containing protein n=1 Tax=Sphingomonas folli TaxID=2862497 RepID=UPI001CA52368|nr:TonB-dependent receptor [Sphingomonas folli]MBW6529022.1 TonB-dependent receptor [Sphingomonas folli]
MRRVTLLAATALVGGAMVPAIARAQAAPDTPAVDEPARDVVVTGSRIVRPAYEGVIPGAQVSGEQIQRRAFTNVLDALTDVPLIEAGASPYGTNGGQPSSLGQSYVDLLGLGSNRTLTLLNGRRYVSGNAATLFVAGNITGSQVDLGALPAALIERTDVVTVGGAVAYGSDAVAGVVNIVLKDHFQSISAGALSGLTARGDGARQRLSLVAGRDLAGGRGNVTLAVEYDHDDALTGDRRAGRRAGYFAPTSFRNGGRRDTAYQPSLDGGGGSAFFAANADGVPNNIAGAGYLGGSLLESFPGAVFSFAAPGYLGDYLPAAYQGPTTTDPNDLDVSPHYRPQALWSIAGNLNIVPGRPVGIGSGCRVTDLSGFCAFAPASLPGTRASDAGATARDAFDAAVIARFAPALAGAGGSAAQRDSLALNLLQAHLPTPREYLAQHPGADINAFLGTFTRGFLTKTNTDAATRGALPRVAVPLRFDAAGGLSPILPAVISDAAVTPSTTGGAIGGDAVALGDTSRYVTLHVQQDRALATLLGHYDVGTGLTLYTENQYAHLRSIAPRNGANVNSIAASTAEYTVLTMQLANPFLSDQARDQLRAAGVTDRFLLSRRNQDLVGDSPVTSVSDVYRTVIGARGTFPAFGRTTHYDASLSYGRDDLTVRQYSLLDVEYALAADAVRDASGRIVCRAQTAGADAVGRTPRGVVGEEIVREKGADGRYVERRLRRVATAAQVAACQPLDLFGYGRMSAAARGYVAAPMTMHNRSEMVFGQATLSGAVADLPGGALRYALFGEYRREGLDYRTDRRSHDGALRWAPLAPTEGHIQSVEFGGETSVPLLGQDVGAPLLRGLTLNPGIRFVRQSGAAPDVSLLDGGTLVQHQQGKWNRVWSLAGTWTPFDGLLFRGNITRSIRQPNISELFLGGQSAFTTPTDPCASNQIGQGTRPALRLANCRKAVIDAGLASDTAGADRFLNDYVPSGATITGVYDGTPGLRPERGRSWTVGAILTPAVLPRLRLGVDYLRVRLVDQIAPGDIDTAMQLCLDSPGYPNNRREIGANTCDFFRRIPAGRERAFEVDNGFTTGFINLGKLQVEAANATLDYRVPLGEGALALYGNVYRLFHYLSAPDNDLALAQESAGSIGVSKWRTQLRPSVERGGFFAQWVWNWYEGTRYFSSGAPVAGTDARNEVRDFIRVPAYSLHDASIGYSFGEQRRFGVTFNVRNVFDKMTAGTMAQSYAFGSGIVDDFGRRLTLSVDVTW